MTINSKDTVSYLRFDSTVNSSSTAYQREAGKDAADELVHRVAREPLQELALSGGLVDDAEAGVDGGADVLVPERCGGGRAEAGEERLQHPHEHGLLGGGLGPGLEAAAGDGVDDLPERGTREGGPGEGHDLVERGERGGGDGGAGVLGADGVEEGPQRGGGERGRRGGGGGGEGEAAERAEGGDERVLGGGVVGRRGARVAEAPAHDGEHGAGLGGDRAGERRLVGPAIGGGPGAARVVGLLGDGVDAAGAERPGAAHSEGQRGTRLLAARVQRGGAAWAADLRGGRDRGQRGEESGAGRASVETARGGSSRTGKFVRGVRARFAFFPSCRL